MRNQRLVVVITFLNLVLLLFSLGHTRAAGAEGIAPILRGRGLEIVDGSGRVGLLLGGESDPTYVQILAQGPRTSLKLSDKDGREQLIKP